MARLEKRPWTDLTTRQRQAQVAVTVLHVVLAWAAVLTIYFLLPLEQDGRASAVLRIVLAFALLVGFVGWELSRILDSHVPTLRAGQALGAIVIIFMTVFASVYLALSQDDPGRFTQPLTHVSALYFTVTVLATVGFGDITPVGDTAQIIVTAQMILDLVLIGLVARLILAAAKLSREQGPRPSRRERRGAASHGE